MSNGISPCLIVELHQNKSLFEKLAYKHIYHCQFPENINKHKNKRRVDIDYIYKVIVNSEYTYDHLFEFHNDKLRILYPLCTITSADNINQHIHMSDKLHIRSNAVQFVTVGRLFPYHEFSNNKNIDVMVNAFLKLSELHGDYDFQFHVICSVKDYKYYQTIVNSVADLVEDKKILFYPDCDDAVKEEVLYMSQYYIHATGIRNISGLKPSEEEHFGISVIESLKTNCIPIIANRGFPPHIIKHNMNGYVFDSTEELLSVILDICGTKERFIKQFHDINEILKTNQSLANNYCDPAVYKSNFMRILMNG